MYKFTDNFASHPRVCVCRVNVIYVTGKCAPAVTVMLIFVVGRVYEMSHYSQTGTETVPHLQVGGGIKNGASECNTDEMRIYSNHEATQGSHK